MLRRFTTTNTNRCARFSNALPFSILGGGLECAARAGISPAGGRSFGIGKSISSDSTTRCFPPTFTSVAMRNIGTTADGDEKQPTPSVQQQGPVRVKNPFNGKLMKSTSRLMASLERVGFCFVPELGILASATDKKTKPYVLDVVDGEKLNTFARLIRTRRAILPLEWKGAMKIELGGILQCDEIEDAAEQIRTLVKRLYEGRAEPHQYDSKAVTGTHVKAVQGLRAGVVGGSQEDDLEEAEEIILNAEQQSVVDLALQGYNMYIGGQAGTGKTVVLRAIRRALARKGAVVAMTATTGIAGCHIAGCTFHHAFGCDRYGEFKKEKSLRRYNVVIIDEISMMDAETFKKFDQVLQFNLGNSLPFGGCQILVCGDFLQLSAINSASIFKLPRFKNNFLSVKLQTQVRQAEHPRFAKQLAMIRKGVVPDDLTQTVRMVSLEEEVPDAVYLMPRNREVSEMNKRELEKLPGDAFTFDVSQLSPTLNGEWTKTVTLHTSDQFDDNLFRAHLLQVLNEKVEIFPNELSFYRIAKDGFVCRVKLPPATEQQRRIVMCDAFEETLKEISQLLDQGSRVLMVGDDTEESLTPEDDALLTVMMEKHPVVKPLDLKIGARVLLRANLSPKFVNGSIGVVEKLVPCEMSQLPGFLTNRNDEMSTYITDVVESYHRFLQFECGHLVPSLPVVRFGEKDSDVITIPPWKMSVGGQEPTNYFEQSAICLPLSLAYAFTVHKVQGLTLRGKVHIKLNNMWQCEHLMYVGMSRVRHPEQLTIAGFKEEDVAADPAAVQFDSTLPAPDRAKPRADFCHALWKKCDDKKKPARVSSLSMKQMRKQQERDFEAVALKRAVEARQKIASSAASATVSVSQLDPESLHQPVIETFNPNEEEVIAATATVSARYSPPSSSATTEPPQEQMRTCMSADEAVAVSANAAAGVKGEVPSSSANLEGSLSSPSTLPPTGTESDSATHL